MASPVIKALEDARLAPSGSSHKGYFWAFRHPNPDAPPQTYRLTRRAGNGWVQLLAASLQTREVLHFHADTEEDQQAVRDALRWLGITGAMEVTDDGVTLRLAGGTVLKSTLLGGEKPKKK